MMRFTKMRCVALLSVALFVAHKCVAAPDGRRVAVLLVDTDHVTGKIEEPIYGQFLEHINHSVVDGLYAEQIQGQGFEGKDFQTYWKTFADRGTVQLAEVKCENGDKSVRIEVNHELESLDAGLPAAFEMLRPGGRLAVLSFHSLEDRIAKRFLRDLARGCTCPPELPICVCGHEPELRILTPKPVRPTASETASNPRTASARLRAGVKV